MLKKTLMIIVIFIFVLAGAVIWILNLPDFGRLPTGARLERIQASTHFVDSRFVSPESTQTHLKKGFFASMRSFLFDDRSYLQPQSVMPSAKVDLNKLDPKEDLIVWMGHSSFYLQLNGKKILVDPIFSGHASPFKFMIKAFKGTDLYSAEDMPKLDALLISHDHWDHLDYETVTLLKDKVSKVITGLGTGEHFEYWGYNNEQIIEKDWYEEGVDLDGVKITLTPARHFSGRFLTRNPTLPVSFVFESPERKVFYSGDGAFGKHFAEIANRYGPFDYAVMEDGQYNEQWHFVHMYPEEMIEASKILGAKYVLPVHNSKFILSEHKWDEPLQRASQVAQKAGIMLNTPLIGQKLSLDDPKIDDKWWEKVK